jgi:hypothetical protein
MVNLYRWSGTGLSGTERHWIEELPEPGLPGPATATAPEPGDEIPADDGKIVYEFRVATPEDARDAD